MKPEQAKIKSLEGTIRRRDRMIVNLQNELDKKQRHLDRIKNDLLPPIYREIQIVAGQRDVAKADVSVIQAWICALMQQEELTRVNLANDVVSAALEKFRLKAEKNERGVTLCVEVDDEDGTIG